MSEEISVSKSSNLLKNLALGLGTLALSIWTAVLITKAPFDQLLTEIWDLRRKIKSEWKENPVLEHLQMKSEKTLFLPKYKNTQFYIKIVQSEKFASKKVKTPHTIHNSPGGKHSDPFCQENIRPLFIADLSSTHSLLYNKYHLVPYHVLIITKEFMPQGTLLTEQDFSASLKVMRALRGFVFFNSGPTAGASQEHRHLQAIPYSSYPNQAIPIDNLIKETIKDEDISKNAGFFTLPQFQFKHIFYKFPQRITKGLRSTNLNEKAEIVLESYKKCLKKLDNENLDIAYNLVLSKKWIFLVLRKSKLALDLVKINAVAFTGSFAVKSEEEHEFILTHDPFHILTLVSYPQ